MDLGLTWALLQHVSWEGPGLILTEARARGISIDVRRLDVGDAVPRVADVAGVIVMGGPMGVGDVSSYPHLATEQRLLRDAVDRRLPTLGVCLGAQLMAAALGARVYRGPKPEIGVGDVTLTPEGRTDRVLGPTQTVPVMHWHEDTFELPSGATLLAGTTAYPNQAFRMGTHAYGLQFHVELDRELAATWARQLPRGTTLDEPSRRMIEQAGRRIIGRFFEAALGRD